MLVNSGSPDYADWTRLLEPYLVQWGVPYQVRDIALQRDLPDAALYVVGHRALDPAGRFFDPATLAAKVRSGAGLLNFDAALMPVAGSAATGKPSAATSIDVNWPGQPARSVALKSPIPMPETTSSFAVHAKAGGRPLVLAGTHGEGRVVLFTSYDWVRPEVKGKVYGLDDLVWRSIVHAARKPFVVRGMPRFLAFRVDDVAGFGIGSNQHLGWMEPAVRHGLKPWVGLFIDDLRDDTAALKRLAAMTRRGDATASVHARRWREFFYLDEPLKTDHLGRNIAGRPWSDAQMAANWAEAEAFFAKHGIRKSPVILPHFYQFGANAFSGMRTWGAEFVCTVLKPGWGYGTPVPPALPYLRGEPPRSSSARDPIFLADWLETPAGRFFNFVLEIRDDAGYEWAPSRVPVAEAIRRGVDQSRRAFDSLLPAVLFTHESDHIRAITPDDWERILAGVMDGLKPYRPVSVTLDELMRYMRALATSRLESAQVDGGSVTVNAAGHSDVPVKFYVYESDADAAPRESELPPFRIRATVRVAVR